MGVSKLLEQDVFTFFFFLMFVLLLTESTSGEGAEIERGSEDPKQASH